MAQNTYSLTFFQPTEITSIFKTNNSTQKFYNPKNTTGNFFCIIFLTIFTLFTPKTVCSKTLAKTLLNLAETRLKLWLIFFLNWPRSGIAITMPEKTAQKTGF